MFRLRLLIAIVLFAPSLARAEPHSQFANEALAEVDKLLSDALPETSEVESYIDCIGETVYVKRADQKCAYRRRTLFIVEPVHSVVATYCLQPKEDPRKNSETQVYFNKDGRVAEGWLMTTRRPSRDFLRHLRCRAQSDS